MTVVFADLVGFTSRAEALDPEDVQAILRPYHLRLREELQRHGGTVEKFIGDAVMAVFGAPTAHEDDPERGVRAALGIRDWAREEGSLEVRLAVTTGEALVSLDARPDAGEGMVAGDVVNTAARLQQAAPPFGVLVGEATYRATRDAIEYRPAQPAAARGKAAPVPVWEALQPRSRPGVDPMREVRSDLVGRGREVRILGEALERVRQERSPQLVTLVGVPGIGKSRLVWELARMVENDPEIIYWRQGRSLPYGDGVTFWAVAEMAKAQLGILESDDAAQAAEKLEVGVAGLIEDEAEAQWVERHLRPLAGLDVGRERDAVREQSFAAWRRFFEAMAERRPVVLVFEDLHWADDALLDFADHLVEWATAVPLLVVGTARPELLERRPGWGGGKRNATTVSLSPLSDEETARLLSTLLEQAVLPADFQRELLARTGGNPLWTEEYVRMLVDRGFIRRDGGHWRLEPAAALPLPESVQGIIAARLDALSRPEKAMIQDAAVIGKGFWIAALAQVGGVSPADVEEHLHALERKEFLRRERRSTVAAERQYVFSHVLVRDVAYGQIPRALRAEKHAAAAEWIESIAPERVEDHSEMLAHHYLAALEYTRAAGQETRRLAERARTALAEAGDRASALNAFAAAARFYCHALELTPDDDPARHNLRFRYARALVRAEGADIELLEEARAGLLAMGDRASAAEADAVLADVLWWQGKHDAAYERFQRAVGLLADLPPSPAKAYVLSRLVSFLMVHGSEEEAVRVGLEALAMAEDLELGELAVHVLTSVGVARIQTGDLSGLADLERALETARLNGSPEASRCYFNLATAQANLGDLPAAFELQARGREAASRFGDVAQTRWAAGELIYEHYWRGEWEEALAAVEPLVREAQGDQGHYLWYDCLLIRGWIALARGELEQARDDAEALLSFGREAKAPQALQPALAFAARAAVEAGADAEARRLVDELLDQTRTTSTLSGFWNADLAVAATATGLGERYRKAASTIRPSTRWLEAAAAYCAGEYVRAAERYAVIGSVPDEAFARLRAADALVAAGRRAEADEQVARALAFHRRVNARAYVRRGEALLPATA